MKGKDKMKKHILVYFRFREGYGNVVCDYEGEIITKDTLDMIRGCAKVQIKKNTGCDASIEEIVIANIMPLEKLAKD